eukprot:1138597-Pelagomonas_calceolata.AAC.1
MPATPIKMCRVTLLFLFGFLELRVLSLAIIAHDDDGVRMLSCCMFESDERIRVRVEFHIIKVDVPVLRRDLGGIK